MKGFRRIVFGIFLVSTLSIIAFAFWFFSNQPSKEEIAKAFPLDSFKTFSNGKKLTLYSIEPNKKIENAETFQGYSVVGKTEIHDRAFQHFLKLSFLKDLIDVSQNSQSFQPRYALQISEGKVNVDIVICFECGKFLTFFENKKMQGDLAGNSKNLFKKTLSDAQTINSSQ